MKEQGDILVPYIWMFLLEAKRGNIMQYRGQACLSEADPTATQDKSQLSVTSKEAESEPQNAYGHMKSKPLANTVSNHHPCFQISSLYKHFFQLSHSLEFYVSNC